jgi:hypothetical protein
MKKLYWVQEGMLDNNECNTKLFSAEVEKETPKTFVFAKKNKASFGLKVANKSLVGVRLFHTATDALNAKADCLRERLSQSNDPNNYLRRQLVNIEKLLLHHGQIGLRCESLSPHMEVLKRQIGQLNLQDTIYDSHATLHQLQHSIKYGAENQAKTLTMRLVWLRRRYTEIHKTEALIRTENGL